MYIREGEKIYVIIEYEGDRFAVWDEDDMADKLEPGRPFLGVPWKELKPGTALKFAVGEASTQPIDLPHYHQRIERGGHTRPRRPVMGQYRPCSPVVAPAF